MLKSFLCQIPRGVRVPVGSVKAQEWQQFLEHEPGPASPWVMGGSRDMQGLRREGGAAAPGLLTDALGRGDSRGAGPAALAPLSPFQAPAELCPVWD